MKRIQWAIAILIITGVQCVYADSFDLTGARIVIYPNLAGDNMGFTFLGQGVNISGSGSTVCGWCTGGVLLPAGSRLTPNVDLLGFAYSQGAVTIWGGTGFRTESVDYLSNSLIYASSFTFPTNGQKTFTISVPAYVYSIGGTTVTRNDFLLWVPYGKLRLTFEYNPYGHGYEFSQGMFTAGNIPEPGTLGLMGSGLAGIIGAVLKKRSCKRAPK